MARSIDWDKVREDDNDNTTAEVIRAALRDYLNDPADVETLLNLAVFAVANAGNPQDFRSTAAAYDGEVDHLARLAADKIISDIWEGLWYDRKNDI